MIGEFDDIDAAESLLSSFEVDGSNALDRFTVKTLAEVAQFFGLAPQTVRTWRMESPPMPGHEGRWSLPEIVQWRLARVSQSDAMQAQRNEELEAVKLKNEKLRIDIAIRNGKWIDKEEVTRTISLVCSRARNRLENLPYNVAMLVPSDCKAEVIHTVAEVVRLTLKELADSRFGTKENEDE